MNEVPAMNPHYMEPGRRKIKSHRVGGGKFYLSQIKYRGVVLHRRVVWREATAAELYAEKLILRCRKFYNQRIEAIATAEAEKVLAPAESIGYAEVGG